MPIYEYQCDECGHLFEEMKKRSAPEPAACPKCDAPNPRRAISRTGFKLKGSGWYVTDYKTGNGAQGASGDRPSAGTESGSDDSGGSDASDDSDGSDPDPPTANVA